MSNRYVQLIDTHCHINVPPMIENLANLVLKCQSFGLEKIVVPGTDILTSEDVLKVQEQYPENILAAIGIHPQILETEEIDFVTLEKLVQHSGVIAIGEIGLDFEVTQPAPFVQEKRLCTQLNLAYKNNIPVLLHCRKAFGRLLELLQQFHQRYGYSPGGILHSWAGAADHLQNFIKMGFFYGVSGVITLPHATKRRQVLESLPLDRMVLETDAPYIGTKNTHKGLVTPLDLPEIAQAVAEIKKIPYQEICEITAKNARQVLRVSN